MSKCLTCQNKIHRQCILWELCVISLLFKITPMIRNCIWQRMGTKLNCVILHTQGGLEQTQCHQQNQTVGYSICKGAWSRHSASNSNRLTSYGHGMQTTQATLETVKVTRRMEWSSVLNAVLRSNMAVKVTSLSSAFTNRQSRTLSTASLYVMILPVGRLTHFQETPAWAA